MKMDKREIILCLLFACLFITMIFIRAFAVDAADPGSTLPVHGKQSALEILEDDTSYNTWLDNLRAAGAEVASNVWSTASDMARNLLAYGVGCVANTTEEVLQVAFPDLEHYLGDMYFDWDRLEWEFTDAEDVEDFIKTGLEPYAFDQPDTSGAVHGQWYLLPQVIVTMYNGNQTVSGSGGDVYVCCVLNNSSDTSVGWNKRHFLYASFDSGCTYTQQGGTNSIHTSYTGTVSSGYYVGRYGGNDQYIYGHQDSYYSDNATALADLFGWDGTINTEPVLNGDVIYFDDPQFAPLGYYPSTGLDFSTIVNEGNTNNYDYSVVNVYNTYYPSTYSFDIPYWLKVPSTVPKLYDLPSDYDFQNIQFDYEADVTFLDGAGVIQDVYDVLPLKLQNLIILFGAGTCAFIFLRR